MKNTCRKRRSVKKLLRVLAVIAVVGALIASIVISMSNKGSNTPVWDEQTTLGKLDAKNHFIIYSDFMCPYCVAFEIAMIEHKDELLEYIEKNDILLEIRTSEFLYDYGQHQPIDSRYSAEATYCAKNEGKFWDYYDLAIEKVWYEHFLGLGNDLSKSGTLGKEYWIKIGEEVGLGEDFRNCVLNDESLTEVKKYTDKSAKLVNGGLPYFKFNDFTPSGFDPTWGWDKVLQYFDAGLES